MCRSADSAIFYTYYERQGAQKPNASTPILMWLQVDTSLHDLLMKQSNVSQSALSMQCERHGVIMHQPHTRMHACHLNTALLG